MQSLEQRQTRRRPADKPAKPLRRAFTMAILAVVGCAPSVPPEPAGTSKIGAADVAVELREGAVLLDVRGPMERDRDGVPAFPFPWLPYGPDHWRGQPGPDASTAFLHAVATTIGPPAGQRVLVLCSIGVRSAAAARRLNAAGYDAENILDGWLGNSHGPGLRALEPTSGATGRTQL